MDDIGQNLSRGTNQSGGRIYNERLVLSIVRHRDGLPKAEIAKLTGLSAQTISVIMQQLEADHSKLANHAFLSHLIQTVHFQSV